MAPAFPPDREDQLYVSVKPIVAGNMFLPHKEVFQDSIDLPESEGVRIPVFCFFISHPTEGDALFDLGVRKHVEGYPPSLQDEPRTYFDAVCEEDVTDHLKKGGVDPANIRNIFLSHLHWDHTGDATPFTSATLTISAEAKTLLETNVYPKNPEGSIPAFPEGNAITYVNFESTTSRPVIAPFVTFERGIDIYGDGSLYMVDTPGHYPGHYSLVARVAPDSFLFMAADLCHNRLCYAPGHRILSKLNYADVETARKSAQRLAALNREVDNVVVILAHETQRTEEGMPFFPNDVREWVVEEIEKRKNVIRP
ncbi:Metallo-hydrolase/oxidoreductase [Trametopsis cervina]|nr:Metallo-hydrolase/oxidoreductase [Trametopsis cervina]